MPVKKRNGLIGLANKTTICNVAFADMRRSINNGSSIIQAATDFQVLYGFTEDDYSIEALKQNYYRTLEVVKNGY